ncbi:sensor histidine kinase [Roseicella aquatilis]|uniref:histidine kinase n=1 Tax=Roseicella aquatilis TaxID=2527868 RepID=A0A4R4DM06_9PROT|nr:sensor histidine kinase [Roseicella aquatilis]TCZ61113.1 sensor histidine kinase [Roseicella aquatilis]
MLDLARMALTGGDRDALMTEAMRVAAAITDSDFVKVLERTPEGDFLVTFGRGWNLGEIVGLVHIAAGADALPTGRAAASGSAAHSEASCGSPATRVPGELVAAGIESTLDIPIRGAHAVHGVMQLDSRVAAAVGVRTAERLRDVADLLGLALDASAKQKAEAEMLTKAHALMLREVDHRAANSLAIVASTLALQARVAGAAPASEGLLAAAARVAAIAAVHRQLHRGEAADGDWVDVATLLHGFVAELATMLFGAEGRDRLVFAAEPGVALLVPVARASALCMIAAELATNAAKYAGTAGPVTLWLVAGPGTDISISAEDGGPGFPPGFDPMTSSGLGMRLLHRLAGPGRERITIDRVQGGGARITVRVAESL